MTSLALTISTHGTHTHTRIQSMTDGLAYLVLFHLAVYVESEASGVGRGRQEGMFSRLGYLFVRSMMIVGNRIYPVLF